MNAGGPMLVLRGRVGGLLRDSYGRSEAGSGEPEERPDRLFCRRRADSIAVSLAC